MNNITKEQFERYEEIRESSVCNMFDLSAVVDYAGDLLTKLDIVFIQSHYEELCATYGPTEEEIA